MVIFSASPAVIMGCILRKGNRIRRICCGDQATIRRIIQALNHPPSTVIFTATRDGG
jgi:hypothetical protein